MRKNQVLGGVSLVSVGLVIAACGLDFGVPLDARDAAVPHFEGDAESDAADGAASSLDSASDSRGELDAKDATEQRDGGDLDAQADTNMVDAQDAQDAGPLFPTCTIGVLGGASLLDVEAQGGDSLGALFFIPRAIPTDPDIREYVNTNHIFRLLRTGIRLPAFTVASGRGRVEISFDARLGPQEVYAAVTSTVQLQIGLCSGVNLQSEPCLTTLITALRCEVIKDITSGCPPIVGITKLGRYQTYSLIDPGKDLIRFGVVTCPP